MPQARPRVALNAHLLNLRGSYRSAGISWYTLHLLKNLETIPEFEYTVFLSDARAHEHLQRLHLVQSRLPTHRPIVRILWEQFVQPFALRASRADLLHALAFAGPRLILVPWIVTIYDLSFVKFPASFNALNRVYLTYAVRDAVRRADRVIAISASTQRDLVANFAVPSEKVRVIYCGIDPIFAHASPPKSHEKPVMREALPKDFVLYVGTIEPRKNIACLVRAFGRAKRASGLPHSLLLVGARGWKYSEIERIVEAEGLEQSVKFIGYVPPPLLAEYYRAADLFVYPSLYEGFGLPPLEAMASGTPVITSNASSLPEVVGDAAIMVSPEDEAALAEAMKHVLSDKGVRKGMIARGATQAQKFSWARAASETAGVYHEVLSA